MQKLYNKKGEARLVWIFAVIAFILAIVAVSPAVKKLYETKMESLDEDYIHTAERMAKKYYLDNPKSFVKVFDSEHKKFVDPKDVKKVPSYANAASHEGMFLLIKADEEGNITCEWMKKEKIEMITEGV